MNRVYKFCECRSVATAELNRASRKCLERIDRGVHRPVGVVVTVDDDRLIALRPVKPDSISLLQSVSALRCAVHGDRMCIRMLSFGFQLSRMKRIILTSTAQAQSGSLPRQMSHRLRGADGYGTSRRSLSRYAFCSTSTPATSSMVCDSVCGPMPG